MKPQGMEYEILKVFLAIWDHLNDSISKHIIKRNVKNDDSIVKITHTYTYTHIHRHQKII